MPKTTESKSDFRKALEGLINIHSMENGSDTPDFVLARYLTACLEAYEDAHNYCVEWHSPAGVSEARFARYNAQG